tara:strand:- start:1029 stop:1205 length:177 start_codon:yes stop_codon:yes gene_type:complete
MSISPISIHNYVAETLSLTKLHEYNLPKTTEQAIKDFREHQRVNNGAWYLGNKLDIMV